MSVYRSKDCALLRCVNSYKWDDLKKTPLIPEWSTNQNVSISETLITTVADDSILLTVEKQEKVKEKRGRKRKLVTDEACSDDPILQYISKLFPAQRVEWNSDKEYYYLHNDGDVVCPITGHTHSSNAQFIKIDDVGSAYVHCTSARCKANKKYLFNTNLYNSRMGKKVWDEGIKITDLKDQSVQEIVFDKVEQSGNKVKCKVIKASMGQGKTCRLTEFLQKHKPKRILAITSRVQLANTLLGVFPDFDIY